MKGKMLWMTPAWVILFLYFACSPKDKAGSGKKAAGEAGSLQGTLSSSLASPEELAEALRSACWSGDINEAQRLLHAGAGVNAADSGGFTPLMRACERGNAEIARALIQAGADPHAARGNGGTALLDASGNNQPEALRVLIAAGADPNAKTQEGKGAMFWAAGYGFTEVVRILARAGCRIEDPVDAFGTTPLMHAVENGQAETAAALLELGAKVNARDSSGKTALQRARTEGKNEIAEILLKAGGAE